VQPDPDQPRPQLAEPGHARAVGGDELIVEPPRQVVTTDLVGVCP
jgi:hypothetical protein